MRKYIENAKSGSDYIGRTQSMSLFFSFNLSLKSHLTLPVVGKSRFLWKFTSQKVKLYGFNRSLKDYIWLLFSLPIVELSFLCLVIQFRFVCLKKKYC